MANRAYLFNSDRDDPDVWRHRDEIYFDSRWTVPLSWWFLFEVPDIRLVDVHYDGSTWQEVKFVTDKGGALLAFNSRRSRLMRILGMSSHQDLLLHFLNTLRTWPGKYLFMDPEEVFGGAGVDDGHYRHCRRILEIIGSESSDVKDVIDAVSSYSSVEFDNRDEFIGQVIGYTYQ